MTEILTQQFLVETWVSVGNKIDVLWNMFIAIHFAVFGFIFTVNQGRLLHPVEKLIGIVAYIMFMFINARALLSSYEFLQGLTVQYQETYLKSAKLNDQLREYISGLDYSGKAYMLIMTHGFGLVIVCFALGFADKYLSRHYRKKKNAATVGLNKKPVGEAS